MSEHMAHEKQECDSARHQHGHSHKGKSSESRLDPQTIVESLALQPGMRVMDAGCGGGYMTLRFSELVGETGSVIALDPDTGAIDDLSEVCVEKNLSNVTPLVGDITSRTPFDDESLDLIYISMVVHGFSSEALEGFRQEAARLLKRGGKLAVIEVHRRESPFGPPLELRYSPDMLVKALGFRPAGTMDVGEHIYLQLFTA